MSATIVTAAPVPPPPLEAFRDDGPLARAIGGALGRRLPLPGSALALAAALPLALAIALGADSHGVAAFAVVWAVATGGLASGRPATGRLAWAVPPLLRVTEYGGLIWIATLAAQDDSAAAAFALLAVVAFRQYDIVYRLRHQGRVAPRWLAAIGGGWEGRLVAGLVLLLAGALPAGFFVAAGVLAVVFVAESIASWRGAVMRPTLDDEDEEEEGG